MIITCPSCSTRYPVDASSFAPSGRKVRCAKCGHSWHQAPPTDLPGKGEEPEDIIEDAPEAQEASIEAEPALAPAPVPSGPLFKTKAEEPPAETAAAPEAPAEGETRETPVVFAETPASQAGNGGKMRAFIHNAASTRRGRVLSTVGWVLLAAFVVSTLYAGWHFRDTIASFWPKTTKLYAAVDNPFNLRGFEFRGVGYERQTENGLPVLAVKGEVVNVTNEARAVPRLRVGLFDKNQRELYHWTFALAEKELGPKASAPFVTRLSSPPVDARDLELRFVQKDEENEPASAPAAKATAQ
jgi:predicted Zn finger-like uncharacterized protein